MYIQLCFLSDAQRLRNAGLDKLTLTIIAEEAKFLLGLDSDEGPNEVVKDSSYQNEQEEYLSL